MVVEWFRAKVCADVSGRVWVCGWWKTWEAGERVIASWVRMGALYSALHCTSSTHRAISAVDAARIRGGKTTGN